MVDPDFLPQGFIIVLDDKPKLAKADAPIYLAGNWNGWNPKDPKFKLEARSDLRWQIIFEKPLSDAKLEFKFTRGDWEVEELNDDLSTPANRLLPKIDASKLAPGERPIIEMSVPKWGDQRPNRQSRPDLDPYYKLDVTGTVQRVQVAGGGVATMRDVLVWLPPGYDKPEAAARRYPVLYLHDGQNVFMKMPNVPGEWGADETATRLIKGGRIEEIIIVAIPHAGTARASEYLPFELVEGVRPRGEQYARWLVGEVVPRINSIYRTKTGPENTAVGGASLGGVIALYAATEHPSVFGKVLAESVPLVSKDGAADKFFRSRGNWPAALWFGMGENELGTDPKNADGNKRYVAAHAALRDWHKAGPGAKPGARSQWPLGPGAVHDENAWAARLGDALEFLFPAAPSKGN
jgi:predicted alpha/beta superfamily hydrolase